MANGKFIVLLFAFYVLHSSFAGIVSDYSKMFFTGGDWLPDAVPNSAIYDSTNIVEKELRVTTNVTAAVYSCLSGVWERLAVMQGMGYALDGLDEYKTLDFPYYREYWGIATNRCIQSARLVSGTTTNLSILGECRAILDDVANPETDEHYGSWPWARWGSSKFDGLLGLEPTKTALPQFGYENADGVWTNKIARLFGDYTRIWPEYSECLTDGVWKVSQPYRHLALCEAIELFGNGEFYPAASFDPAKVYMDDTPVYSTPLADATCFGLLEDRFGRDNALQFTNDTRRLGYYQLGTVEAAIASMDTTYMDDWIYDLIYFNILDLTYEHALSWLSVESTAHVTFDSDQYCTFRTAASNWKKTETWTTRTNELYSTSEQWPYYALLFDSPVYSGTVEGSAPFRVGYQIILDAWDHCVSQLEAEYGPESGWRDTRIHVVMAPGPWSGGPTVAVSYRMSTVAGGGTRYYPPIDASMGVFNVDFDSSGTFEIHRLAYGARHARVSYSADYELDDVSIHSTAQHCFRDYSPSVECSSCEVLYGVKADSRYGDEPNLGLYTYYVDGPFEYDGMTYRDYTQLLDFALWRLDPVSSTNALASAWRRARANHRGMVRARAASFGGVDVEDIESVVPFAESAVGGIRNDVEAMSSGRWSILCTPGAGTFSRGGGGFLFDDGSQTTTLEPGGTLTIGSVQINASLDNPVGVIPSNTLFAVTGTCRPASRTRWTFKNLHEEEE